MKIIIKGKMNGRQTQVDYFLYDESDPLTQTSSMSRTTGYTCTAALNLLADKVFTEKGVFPPELIGSDHACSRLNILERQVLRLRAAMHLEFWLKGKGLCDQILLRFVHCVDVHINVVGVDFRGQVFCSTPGVLGRLLFHAHIH